MVIAVGWASVSAFEANAFLGIRLGGGIEVNTSIGETNGRFNITCMRYFYFGGAANGQVFELGGWMETRATTADNFTVNDVRFLVLPFSPLATNTYT